MIEPWKDSGKFALEFSAPAKAITPIPMVKGGHAKNFQSARYTTFRRLMAAKSLDDLW